MCNFVPLRNWLIALAIATGWAVSSGWFAYAWNDYPFVGAISWSITLTAAIATSVCLVGALTAASTFCACVAAISACTTACSSISSALLFVWAPVAGLIVAAGGALGYGATKSTLLVAMFLVTAAFAAMTIYIASLAITLGSCQAPRAPRRRGPRPGQGAAPLA